MRTSTPETHDPVPPCENDPGGDRRRGRSEMESKGSMSMILPVFFGILMVVSAVAVPIVNLPSEDSPFGFGVNAHDLGAGTTVSAPHGWSVEDGFPTVPCSTALPKGEDTPTGDRGLEGMLLEFINPSNRAETHAAFNGVAAGDSKPEPATMLILGSSLIGLGAFLRRLDRK
jgi:hypothetical protein